MSYSATKTCERGASTRVTSAPSHPMCSPPKVSRQPFSQPVARSGECGARRVMSRGSRLPAYAA